MHTSPLETADHSMGGSGPFFDSPQSQRPLFTTNAWGQLVSDSPVSGHNGMSPELSRGEGGGQFEPAYFSPYSSQYTSPVSASDVITHRMAEWPRDKKVEPEDERSERIEMGAVPSQDQFPGDRKDAHDFEITPVPPPPPTTMQGQRGWQAPQPPIIAHPGNGRGQGGQLRADDGNGIKRGHASF
jgi:hypothetical protein